MADPDIPSQLQPSPHIAVGLHGSTGSNTADETPGPDVQHQAVTVTGAPPSPSFQSPMRHHKRTPSTHREVKETLDAVTEFPSEGQGTQSHHRINQYILKDEIGRGSYGAVHLAVDQFGREYAVKEFSKVRLRKRAQSSLLRRGPHHRPRRAPPGRGFNGPLSPESPGFGSDGPAVGSVRADQNDAIAFIREEVAIMKKLDHQNLVRLIEVLDDPEEDSLYMVLEMCKKGVVMKVGLDGQTAEPYSEETCRLWFRDLILGIEYLHAQGVIHRDIKPDNLLLTEDEVLKVVDFGVSEMFDKPGDKMMTAKSAGSPAFLPPELCVVRHGDIRGKAADIWSMGVCLYCLRYGKLPFDHVGVLEMFEAIRNDTPHIEDENPDLVDLFKRVLEKDPEKRIKMAELREHPWVTKGGEDMLLSAEDNCELIDPPNELEIDRAFTRKMNHLLCVMKVIQKFKVVLSRYRAKKEQEEQNESCQQASSATATPFDPAKEKARAEEIEALVERRRKFQSRQQQQKHQRMSSLISQDGPGTHDSNIQSGSGSGSNADTPGTPGHVFNQVVDADLTDQNPRFLGVGVGTKGGAGGRPRGNSDTNAFDEHPPTEAVSESPTNAEFNVYDRAYGEEVERIMANPARRPTMYLTKFVKERESFKRTGSVIEDEAPSAGEGQGKNFGDIVSRSLTDAAAKTAAKEEKEEKGEEQ